MGNRLLTSDEADGLYGIDLCFDQDIKTREQTLKDVAKWANEDCPHCKPIDPRCSCIRCTGDLFDACLEGKMPVYNP